MTTTTAIRSPRTFAYPTGRSRNRTGPGSGCSTGGSSVSVESCALRLHPLSRSVIARFSPRAGEDDVQVAGARSGCHGPRLVTDVRAPRAPSDSKDSVVERPLGRRSAAQLWQSVVCINGPARTRVEVSEDRSAWLASGTDAGFHRQDSSLDPDLRISPCESSVPLEFACVRVECVQIASVIGTADDVHGDGDEQGKNCSAQKRDQCVFHARPV
jgi:hypothetical protein